MLHGTIPARRDVDDDALPHYRFRTIWISDVHLGTPTCQASHLLDFLKHTESDTLFLVGDIIDGWQLRRRWYWPQTHNDVVQKVLRKARKGTRVVYVAGNHDEAMRQFLGLAFGGIEVCDQFEHTTKTGRRLLILHGDLFDAVVCGAKWLAYVGDQMYLFTLKLNQWLNSARAKLGFPYWSVSRFLKAKVKNAVSYISNFEDALAEEARRRGFDGIVCGHIHHAEIRDIGGVLYCNDGDWVESLTALVEREDGELQIIDWKAIEALRQTTGITRVPGPVTPLPESLAAFARNMIGSPGLEHASTAAMSRNDVRQGSLPPPSPGGNAPAQPVVS